MGHENTFDDDSGQNFDENQLGARKPWKGIFHGKYDVTKAIFSHMDINTFLACRLVCQVQWITFEFGGLFLNVTWSLSGFMRLVMKRPLSTNTLR